MGADDGAARLLEHLTRHALLGSLKHITEAAREVESTLGGLFGTPTDQQFILIIDDNGNRSSRRIKVIDKATLLATIGLLVVIRKCTTTLRTIVEGMERVGSIVHRKYDFDTKTKVHTNTMKPNQKPCILLQNDKNVKKTP